MDHRNDRGRGRQESIFVLFRRRARYACIAERLNKDGIRTRKVVDWSQTQVRVILTHTACKGEHPMGIAMPPLIEATTWQKAQDKRETARCVRKDSKGWLFQGMVFCGVDGFALRCNKKRQYATSYYVCRGRFDRSCKRKGEDCRLPYIRADKLEKQVWDRLKEVLSDREKLKGCVEKAIADLEARKHHVCSEALVLNERLDEVQGKKDRLGVTYADGTVHETLYKQMLGKLNKQEAELLKSREDIDPLTIDGLAALEARLSNAREFPDTGDFVVEDSGMYAVSGKQYLPLGFNAFRDNDGKVALGEIQRKNVVHSEEQYTIPDDLVPGAW